MSKELFAQASKVISDAKAELNKVLNLKDHAHPLLQANQALDSLKNRFNFLAGQKPAQNTATRFPPVKTFLGKKIQGPQKVAAAELAPAEDAKKQFRGRVNQLMAEIGAMEPAKVLLSYTTKDDELVVRGVAKLANVPDYETAELNEAFITSIQDALTERKSKKAQQKNIDENSKKSAEKKGSKKDAAADSTETK